MDHQTDAPHRRSWPSRASVAAPAALAALLALVMLLVTGSVVMAADSDGDGLRDAFERRYELTDPERRDSDGDGVVDSAEDPDDDRLGNLGEQRFGTDPGDRDSDGDGRSDGHEDADRDGRSNARQQDRRPLPAGLRPSLAAAKDEVSPYRDRCLTDAGEEDLTICEFGPTAGPVTLALVGDSRALMILEPIRRVAEAQGWHLVSLVKKACPPILGVNDIGQRRLDDGRSCRGWRLGALDWLSTHEPEHILLVHSDNYRLTSLAGERIYGKRQAAMWRKGVGQTLDRLPAASDVIVLRDIPLNDRNPVHCLRKHQQDISACVTPREHREERATELAIKQAALAHGARYRSVYRQVCSYDPCPVIQGDVLMWRDRGHYTATFAAQLTPTYRTLLVRAISGAGARGR